MPAVNRKLISILIGSLILHLFIAFLFEGTGDSGGWRLAGKTGLYGKQFGMGKGTVYDGDCPVLCSNWPPFTYHYYVAMRLLYEKVNPFHLPQWGYYKILPVFSSVLIAYMIYLLSLAYKLKRPLLLSALFAFNPLSLYISAYHGQREASWMLFLLIAIYILKYKHYLLFAIFLAFSISIKLPPLLFTPFLFLKLPSKKEKLIFLTVVPLIFFLLNLPEIATYTANVFKQVFFYPGWGGWWGLAGIMNKLVLFFNIPELVDAFKPLHKLLLYSAVLLSSIFFFRKKIEFIKALLGITMIIYILSPVFAPQYMLWPLPFLILLYPVNRKYFFWYMITSLYAASNFYGIFTIYPLELILFTYPQKYFYYPYQISYPMDLFFPLWIISIIIYIKILKESKNSKRNIK